MQPFTSRSSLAVLITAFAACIATPAFAVGLGLPELRSHLGEPLRLVVPLRVAPGEGFSDDCVRIVQGGDGDSLPPAWGARARVNRSGDRAEVVVTTLEPMQEPVLRVVVEVGCTASISRDFVMLLDPPINASSEYPGTSTSVAAEAAPRPAAPARRSSSAAATPSSTSSSPDSSGAAGDSNSRPAAAARLRRPARPVTLPTPDSTAVAAAERAARQPAAPATPAPATPAPTTPRLRLEDPAATASSTARPADARPIPPVAVATEATPAPQPGVQETELINKLTSLGAEIELLKRQVAEQSTINAQLRDQQSQSVPLFWVYLLAALLLLAVLFAMRMMWRMQRMQRSVPTEAWWAETRMREGAATILKAGAAADAPVAAAAAAGPGPVMSQADAEREVFYPNGTRTDPNVRIDARLARQDSRIEVEELGATQAMKVLGETNVQMAITSEFSTAVRAAAASQTQTREQINEGIHSLDFDLGSPEVTSTSVPMVDFELDALPPEGQDPGAAAGAAGDFVPLAIRQPNAGPMNWTEARQVQSYLRQTADAIEQADAYLSAGQSESAASVLRRLIQDKEGTPRAPWLMLMQIYRRTDKREAYEGLASKFSAQFGRTPPPWELLSSTPVEPGLDSDPQLLQAIWAQWGSASSMTLLSQLLYDREADDGSFFNLTLQRDLLNFVKICPLEEG